MKFLITGGGTRVKIDEVRYITNMSSGNFANQIAIEAAKEDSVIYLKSKDGAQLQDSAGTIKVVTFDTYEDYRDRLFYILQKEQIDIVICAAAVSDFTVEPFAGKISSSEELSLKLIPTEKLINKIKKIRPEVCLVGFKLVVGLSEKDTLKKARKTLEEASCDFVCANDLKNIRKGERDITIVTDKSHYRIFGREANYIIRKAKGIKNG